MRRKSKIFMGILLLVLSAAVFRIPLTYVEAESTSASDFQMKGNTLVKYTGTASAVSIPTSVKHIGTEAFAGHTELVKIEIPGYVESIDYNAFNGCSSLERIAVPDMVTEIGNGAFSGCSSLKTMSFGKKLKKFGNGVFADCTSLKDVKISKDNKEFSYDSGVIYSKDKTIVYGMLPGYGADTYRMPSGVKEIKSNAFWGCANLKKAEIGSGVQEVPDYAFSNCKNLEKVIFSYSVHQIGLKAFADCINLGDTEIPISVADIHKTAFDGCPKLAIIAEAGSYAAEYDTQRDKSNVAQNEYQDITQSSAEEGINTDAGSQGSESSADGSNAASMLGQSTVVGGNAVVFIDNNRSKVLSGNVQPEAGSKLPSAEIMNGGQTAGLPKYTLVNNEKIAAQAYYGNRDITEYEIPGTIKAIGDFAFARSGLTAVAIPEGVTTIGYGAFYHCDNLENITIPDSVTNIEPSAFDKTKWMEARLTDRQNPFTIVGDGILVAYSGMGSDIKIPEGVKQIGAEVFKDREHITAVTLPGSLLSVGEDAFAGCNMLVSVSGGDNIETIEDRAFKGCPISTIKIPAAVKEIGLKAFDISETGKEDGTKIAVFLGKSIPKVSYEKTATRLINEEYRDAVLKDVRIAIVDDSISASDVENTVLDYDKGGFRGFVCSVEQAAGTDTPGRLKIKFCVMREEDVNANTIPKEVTVYGKAYEISNPEDAVVYASEEQKAASEEGRVTVEVNSSSLPDAPAVTAELVGSKDSYILRISDNGNAGSAMAAAYRKAVSGSKMTSLQVYSIELFDEKNMIPISKLGKQQMTITIPKPKGIAADRLQVVCMDEDGQLEKVASHIVTVDGAECVQFTAEHFSVYGFYN